jgi:hypothetical protein
MRRFVRFVVYFGCSSRRKDAELVRAWQRMMSRGGDVMEYPEKRSKWAGEGISLICAAHIEIIRQGKSSVLAP